MKASGAVIAFLVSSAASSPVGKVVEMLTSLEGKITEEGVQAKALYDEHKAFCEDRTKELGFSIKTAESVVSELKARIDESAAKMVVFGEKVNELAAAIATNEADLKGAVDVRANESADFAAEETELLALIDMIKRAIGQLKRQHSSGEASFLQSRSTASLVDALGAMVDAAVLNSADVARLTALAQSTTSEDSGDDELGAPAGAVYKSHSGNIIDTLEGLLDKADAQLADAREKETNSLHNFELLEQGLKDQIKFESKDLGEAKMGSSAAAERKATDEGDLIATSSDLKEDQAAKADLEHDCMAKAEDFAASSKSREEELKALAEAKKVIAEATQGAEALSYTQQPASFLQLSATSKSGSSSFVVARFLRSIARKQHSAELAQLAARIGSALDSSSGDGPFAKVQTLIADLIAKLEGEATADASKKAFCDKELSESTAKETELQTDKEKLTTKIDQASAHSTQLKKEMVDLQRELSELAQAQAEVDKLRQQEQAAFATNKGELQMGIEAVKQALKILRDYYAKADAAHDVAGASAGIVGLLEVVESDFSTSLAEMTAVEETAAARYEAEKRETQIATVTKSKDMEYKTKQAASLDKAVTELSGDRANMQAELDAVTEYLEKIKGQCVAKAEAYQERVARRAAEISGLKQALDILESEAALLQRGSSRSRSVRASSVRSRVLSAA